MVDDKINNKINCKIYCKIDQYEILMIRFAV
jgi:hypothetical protein